MKIKEDKKLKRSKVSKIVVIAGVFLLVTIVFLGYATYEHVLYQDKVDKIENITVKIITENGKDFGETTYGNYLEIKDKHPQLYDSYRRKEVVEYANYILDYFPEIGEDMIEQTAGKISDSGFVSNDRSIRRLYCVPEYDVVKWKLVTYAGEEFGRVSLKCIDAIYSGGIDEYIPLNKEEKETFIKYKEYVKPHRLKEIYFELPEYKWFYDLSLFWCFY